MSAQDLRGSLPARPKLLDQVRDGLKKCFIRCFRPIRTRSRSSTCFRTTRRSRCQPVL